MGKRSNAALKRTAVAAFGAALALLLLACGGSQDISRLLVSPDKYDIYTCPQIADRLLALEQEGRRLEGLMARAGQGTGGDIINDIAYEPDYLANRGELRELRKSATAKKCPATPPAAPADSGGSGSLIR
jgi:hypothetical protein